MSEEFHAVVRKNKANNHKYITVPRKNKTKEGEEVKVIPVSKE